MSGQWPVVGIRYPVSQTKIIHPFIFSDELNMTIVHRLLPLLQPDSFKSFLKRIKKKTNFFSMGIEYNYSKGCKIKFKKET